MGKVGKPKHVRTKDMAELVELGAANQMPHHEIAKVLGISTHTLRRYYKPELATSHLRAKLQMGGKLYNTGMKGDVRAMKHWLALRGGPEWKPLPVSLHHSGPAGGVIPVATAVAKISDDDAMNAYHQLCKGE